MIISATFSKATGETETRLGRKYIKVRFFYDKDKESYDAEYFTEKQAFQKTLTKEDFASFLENEVGKSFKNCVYRSETEEITLLSNKKGKISKLVKPLINAKSIAKKALDKSGNKKLNRTKNYILQEGVPLPFLVKLGVMTKEGKVIAQKYDKYRQINRFLEYIADISPELETIASNGNTIKIADFGCGKSYLTFAIYHYLHEIKKLPVEIIGLDLKEEVIENCSNLAKEFGYDKLHFSVGDIAKYSHDGSLDMIITLHACDTATDYALSFAVAHNAKVILSVPCCQHEINAQFTEHKKEISEEFAPLIKYGIIKERFAALCTDAIRANALEQAGYSVQMLEFIDMEQTPKNLLIRAVKKPNSIVSEKEISALEKALHITPTIRKLI